MGEDYTGSNDLVFEKVLTTPPDWIDYSDMVPTIDDLSVMSQKLVEMGLWKDSPEDLASFIDTCYDREGTKRASDILRNKDMLSIA